MQKQSQEKAILKHLKKGFVLTPLDALKRFGSFRLGARIYDLKRSGHSISKRMVKKGGAYVAEYSMR